MSRLLGSISRIAALVALAHLTSCGGDVLVKLPVHEPAAGSELSGYSSASVGVAVNAAEDASIGGEYQNLGGTQLGEVSLAEEPAVSLAQLFTSELEAAGHVVDGNGPSIEVVVHKFAARSEATALYWDVFFDAVLTIESTGSRYEVSATDRTYGVPGTRLITRLAEECMHEIALRFRSDSAVHALLQGE